MPRSVAKPLLFGTESVILSTVENNEKKQATEALSFNEALAKKHTSLVPPWVAFCLALTYLAAFALFAFKSRPWWALLIVAAVMLVAAAILPRRYPRVRQSYRQDPFAAPPADKRYGLGLFCLYWPMFAIIFAHDLPAWVVLPLGLLAFASVWWALGSDALDLSSRERNHS